MKKIPEATISRLNLYLRLLKDLYRENQDTTISSRQLANELGINPHQVRKDLSYFGQFGRRGIGYKVKDLIKDITGILGLDKEWNICLCGLGNLGSALISYKGFKKEGLNVVAVFEKDPVKLKKKAGKVAIFPTEKIESIIKTKNIEIGIIAVPAEAAQEIADNLINAGIKAILNFAPVKLSVPKEKVKLRNVDLSIELINLTQFLTTISKKS
jgi:redox-sensing transcriptional repressor